jgi:hypothetical protein
MYEVLVDDGEWLELQTHQRGIRRGWTREDEEA